VKACRQTALAMLYLAATLWPRLSCKGLDPRGLLSAGSFSECECKLSTTSLAPAI